MMNSLSQIAEAFKSKNNFLVIGHYNADADCVGSTLATFYMLKKLGKKVKAINTDSIPKKVSKIEGIENIEFNFNAEKIEKDSILVIVDTGDIKRIGSVAEKINLFSEIIFIDHHVGREEIGTIRFVNTNASATTEILYHLFKEHFEEQIDEKIAMMLYTGLVADTGFFKHSNTTANALEMASYLVKKGASASKATDMLLRIVSFEDYEELSRILSNMKSEENGKLVYTIQLRTKDGKGYADFGVGAVEYLMQLSNIEIGFVVKEAEDKFHLSMRAHGKYDVQKIAESFGGGGHTKAAGCEFKKDEWEMTKIVEVVRQKCLQALR